MTNKEVYFEAKKQGIERIEQMVESGTMTREQGDEAINAIDQQMEFMQGPIGWVITIATTLIFGFIIFFIIVGIYFLFIKFLLKGEGSFASALVASGLTTYISILQVIIAHRPRLRQARTQPHRRRGGVRPAGGRPPRAVDDRRGHAGRDRLRGHPSAGRPVLVVRLAQSPDSGEVCVTPVQCDLGAHLLFPTDFSENADHAFGYVEQLAAAGARRVTLLHVQDQSRIDPYLSHRLAEFDEIDRARLENMANALLRAGPVAVEIELRHGVPLREVLALVRERDVHLVVMGSQGRGYLSELFLGSLSHQVARHAPAPVLLIPAMREAES